jgi:hypothetical protein
MKPESATDAINPAKLYSHPSEVVRASDLSHAAKIDMLRQWEHDARLLQMASEEGMAGGEPNLLAEVKKAQKALGAIPGDGDSGGEVPTKLGM